MNAKNMTSQHAMAAQQSRTPEFLRVAYQLEEQGPPKVHTRMITSVLALLAIAIYLIGFYRVETISSSQGQLTPRQSVLTLQSLDGGLLDQVHVANGDRVERGQLVASVFSPNTTNEIASTQNTIDGLRARIQFRLAHFKENNRIGATTSTVELWNQHASILARRSEALDASAGIVLKQQEGILDQREGLESQREYLETQLASSESIERIHRKLHAKRLIPEIDVMRVEQDTIVIRQSLAELEGDLTQRTNEVEELDAKARELRAKFREEQLKELEPLLAQLSEAEAIIAQLFERRQLNQLHAPIDGVVYQIEKDESGVLIEPGEVFGKILPTGSEIEAKLKVPPRDMPRLDVNQPVRLSIDGVATHKFGYLDGHVRYISPTSVMDENGELFFVVSVSLGDLDSYSNELMAAIRAGASVQATIVTGDRTLAEYLGKPILRGLDRVFGEP